MRAEKYIVRHWASRLEKLVVAQTKRQLKKFGKSNTLSGDASNLRNIWDEICFQQQVEESFYWSAYQDLIDQTLLNQLQHLDQASLLALWAQTDSGFDWFFDHHADEDGHEHAYVDYEAVVHQLRRQLLQNATDENNSVVNEYHYGSSSYMDDDA